MLASGIAAFPSALSATFTAASSHLLTIDFLLTWATAWTVAVCFLVASRHQRTPAWTRVLTALSLAVYLPIAVESKMQCYEANAALVLTASAIALSSFGRSTVLWLAGLPMIVTACAFDATAVLWPIGCLWGSRVDRRPCLPACALIAAGAIGITLAEIANATMWTTAPLPEFLPAVHRDFALFAAVIMLGLAGLLSTRGSVHAQGDGSPHNHSWAVAGLFGSMLALVSLPIDLRLCILPLFWCMPDGLNLLRAISATDRTRHPVLRYVGLVSWAIVIVFAWPALHRWLNGVLFILFR